ncbi:trypsin-like serine peptidase [Janthinobacterium psychrotolerans]|uniref:Serine protease n=1 Tax=Janthinobacterium psychrotolerans TaxID=1747903 RepID=A0A1A7C617_9BURK|nr:serine protease [Janthinobacterium psychrotolerans]OBV41152.1 Trypsin-like peptidase domain-containing protein [Janthinobacterium psychrotolerans]
MNKAITFDASLVPFAKLSVDEQDTRLLAYSKRNVALLKEQFDLLSDAEVAQAQSFDALEAAYGDAYKACEEAIKFARTHDLTARLAHRIAIAAGPEARQRIHAFGGTGAIAIAEGVFDPRNGLTDTTVLLGLCEVNRAICLVLNGKKAVGTGMLVENALVLSAAHVFEDQGYVDDGSKDAELSALLTFQFYGPDGVQTHTARLANSWKVAYGRSCIKQSVDGAIPANAASALDYILVRLETAVPANIPPLKLANLGRIPEPPLSTEELSRRYYIMGYPGGRDAKFAIGTVVAIHNQAARLLHECDTAPGMSGSPLLDDSARIIALHEGRIETRAGGLLHNRATMLRSISTAIEQARLLTKPAPAYIKSPALRRQWTEYGLSAEHSAMRTHWRRTLAAAGVSDRGEITAVPADNFYPIFHFADLDEWLDLPHVAHDTPRVLCVDGAPGRGKTFALQYALARNGSDGTYLVNSGISSGSSLLDMLASLHPKGIFSDATRPAEGNLRRFAEDILDYFESLAAQAVGKRLLIAVDLDPMGAYWEDTYRFWRELALLCIGRSALRLLLCGPSQNLRNELNVHNIGRIVCPTIDLNAVERHCDSLVGQLDMPGESAWVKTRASELWNEARIGNHEQYATCDAARIVIQVRNEMILKGSADEPCG